MEDSFPNITSLSLEVLRGSQTSDVRRYVRAGDLEKILADAGRVYQDKADRQIWSGQKRVDYTHTALLIGVQKLPEPTFTVTESQVREAIAQAMAIPETDPRREVRHKAITDTLLEKLGMTK